MIKNTQQNLTQKKTSKQKPNEIKTLMKLKELKTFKEKKKKKTFWELMKKTLINIGIDFNFICFPNKNELLSFISKTLTN